MMIMNKQEMITNKKKEYDLQINHIFCLTFLYTLKFSKTNAQFFQ